MSKTQIRKIGNNKDDVSNEFGKNLENDEPMILIMAGQSNSKITYRFRINDEYEVAEIIARRALLDDNPRNVLRFIDRCKNVLEMAELKIQYELGRVSKLN